MSVVSWREILPRTFSHSFGNAIECERSFALTLDGPTNTQECLNSVGIKFGDSHPEYPSIYCLSAELTESDFYHAELSISYGVVEANAPNSAGAPGGDGGDGGGGGGGGSGDNGDGPVLNPLSRADVWNFSSSTVEVPVQNAYRDTTIFSKQAIYENNTATPRAITNTAGDAIWSGLTKTVGQMKLTIKGNREKFNWTDAAYVTGGINGKSWLNRPAATWMCQGVSATPQREQVGDSTVRFWEVNVELIYRTEGFILPVINSGLNAMEFDAVTGKLERRRVFVKSEGMPDPGVPADLPVALTDKGEQMKPTGTQYPFFEPITLYYRVNHAIDFNVSFGSSPPNGIYA
jgi:hypothetical protein